jgi:hypothetical protein
MQRAATPAASGSGGTADLCRVRSPTESLQCMEAQQGAAAHRSQWDLGVGRRPVGSHRDTDCPVGSHRVGCGSSSTPLSIVRNISGGDGGSGHNITPY